MPFRGPGRAILPGSSHSFPSGWLRLVTCVFGILFQDFPAKRFLGAYGAWKVSRSRARERNVRGLGSTLNREPGLATRLPPRQRAYYHRSSRTVVLAIVGSCCSRQALVYCSSLPGFILSMIAPWTQKERCTHADMLFSSILLSQG